MVDHILIVDVETTGLDASKDRVVEVACVHYAVRPACVVASFATLIRGEDNAAEEVNRIPVDALRAAPPDVYAWGKLADFVDAALCASEVYAEPGAAVWMAHNAPFDRAFIRAAAPVLEHRFRWVDSMAGVDWPRKRSGDSCAALALAHDVPVVTAHRALADVMLIAQTLASVQRSGVDVGALVARALRPHVRVHALVSFDDRDKAKAAGFRFNLPGAPVRSWTKLVAEEDLPELSKDWPFRFARLEVGHV